MFFYKKKKRRKYHVVMLLKQAAIIKLLKSNYNCWLLSIVLKKFTDYLINKKEE